MVNDTVANRHIRINPFLPHVIKQLDRGTSSAVFGQCIYECTIGEQVGPKLGFNDLIPNPLSVSQASLDTPTIKYDVPALYDMRKLNLFLTEQSLRLLNMLVPAE
uniref:Uncharacterized protein n=1 Tax=Arundo donax TaxID=35708 RepID=A0A0A8Z3J7_ARUDO